MTTKKNILCFALVLILMATALGQLPAPPFAETYSFELKGVTASAKLNGTYKLKRGSPGSASWYRMYLGRGGPKGAWFPCSFGSITGRAGKWILYIGWGNAGKRLTYINTGATPNGSYAYSSGNIAAYPATITVSTP